MAGIRRLEEGAASVAFMYLIQPGDTWPELAERFGVSMEALAAANHWSRVESPIPGQPLRVPDFPLQLAQGAFPSDGWVPREAWLFGEAGGEEEEGADGVPRTIVTDRIWRIGLPFRHLAVALVDHLLLVLHAGPVHPRTGGSVALRLIALNAGPVPLILRYPTAQRTEFVVSREGREVFRASAGRLYAQQIREVMLRPAQSEVAVERFVPESPGEYRVTAWNLAVSRVRLTLTLSVL